MSFAHRCLRNALLASLLLPATARAAADVGYSWSDCVVAPGIDADRDGLDDDCEQALAAAFQPRLIFGSREQTSPRRPYYAIRPDGYHHARIFYATSYYKDGGDSLLGVVSHDGDSEFMVLSVSWLADTNWQLDRAYLSAHYGSSCDEGKDYDYSALEWVSDPRGRPYIHVAEQKHGSYPTASICEAACYYQDSCGDVAREDWGVGSGRDVGLASDPILDDVTYAGNHEYYWTDVVFCGWQRPVGDLRQGCVPTVNSYARELTDFKMTFGPIGDVDFCERCTDDTDCRDGGLCIHDPAGYDFCGRECEGGKKCPAGAECVVFQGGQTQCAPVLDRTCDCRATCLLNQCGPDGCGGTCGTCAAGETCSSGKCECAPQCDGRSCGDDGCGGQCGPCKAGETCSSGGQCVAQGCSGAACLDAAVPDGAMGLVGGNATGCSLAGPPPSPIVVGPLLLLLLGVAPVRRRFRRGR